MTMSTPDTRAAVFAELMSERWSCRAYEPDPVPHETIEALLGVAQRSASWCNTQPWQVIVTEGAGTARFRAALYGQALHSAGIESDYPMPPRYEGVYLERRRASGWQLYESLGIAHGDREASKLQTLENFDLFGAPHVAIITTDATLGVYGAVDSGIYIGSFLLAAHSLGLGAVPQAALATASPFIREYFDLPDDRRVLAGISFGFPDREHPINTYRTSRAALEDTVRWVSE